MSSTSPARGTVLLIHGGYWRAALTKVLMLPIAEDLEQRGFATVIIDKHITPELGNIAIGNLTRLQVQEWASGLPGAPATVRKIVNVLSGALRFAVEDERLPSNPAARLKLPNPTKTRKRYLSHDQVAALAQAIDEMKDGRDSHTAACAGANCPACESATSTLTRSTRA